MKVTSRQNNQHAFKFP